MKGNASVGKRSSAIDLIRGIAIWMVFFNHLGQAFDVPFEITRFGQMGCQMFFVASGFACCYSFAKSTSATEFYRKRMKSLLPGFYTALALVVLANATCVRMFGRFLVLDNIGVVSVLCNVLLVHGLLPFCNNNVFPGGWFVGTIVILYLLHPAMEALYRKTEKHWLVTLGVASAMLVATECVNCLMNGSWVVANNSFVYYLFTNQIGCYVLGMHMNKHMQRYKNLGKGMCLVGLLVSLGLALWMFYGGHALSFVMAPFMVGLATCFLYLLLHDVDIKGKLVDGICHSGRDSFNIYATHWYAAWKFSRTGMRFLDRLGIDDMRVCFFVMLIPCMVLALISAWLLKVAMERERKLLRL